MKYWIFAAAMILSQAFGSAAVRAQIFQNGPYYTTPSWDQQIPTAQRFIVLSNWNNEAVLDRETGLVWERSPKTAAISDGTDWIGAFAACRGHTTGDRFGWRLPSEEELASLLDVATLTLPAGNPFLGAGSIFWSASTDEGDATQAWVASFTGSGFVPSVDKKLHLFVWCVRGGSGVAIPPY